MNKITEEFLLGDKFMPAMNLKQLGFTYSACGPFTKSKELKNLCKQEILFTKMMLIKLAFKMLWLMAKDLARRTESDNILINKFQVIQSMMATKED